MEKKTYYTAGNSERYARNAIKPPIVYAEKIPTSEGVKIPLTSLNLADAREEFKKVDCDKSTRYILRVEYETKKEINVLNFGELIAETVFCYDETTETMKTKEISRLVLPSGYFFTRREALEAGKLKREIYLQAKREAEDLLDDAEETLKALPFEISYTMRGDTHGIYEDYMYITLKHQGYEFTRKLYN